jgi:outer membrane protein OmpA-like peptidoglycan-associated protein
VKNLRNPLLAITSLVLLSSSLAACAQGPQASCEFSRIEGAADVSKEISVVIAPNLSFVDFENVMASSLPKIQQRFEDNKNATLSIVLADGNPEIESSALIEVEEFGYTQTDRNEEVENAISEISKVYRCALGLDGVSSSSSPESDLSLALAKASGAFESDETQKDIFVLSNGISTAGQINFINDGVPSLESFSGKVDQYATQNALVDLKGSNVTWIGLGQTYDINQENLGTQAIEALTDFWRLVVEKSGGVASSINAGNVVNGAPHPNSLEISKVGTNFEKVCINEELGEDQGLVFVGNKTDFVEPSVAKASIEAIAKKINDSGCVGKIVITGYVASNTDQDTFDGIGDIDLSQRRADVVGDLLRTYGVSAEIEAIGAGWGGNPDWDSAGKFDDELGEDNRIVTITQ